MARVFISHAGQDTDLAVELHSWITEQGHDAFFDQDVNDGLVGGEDWHHRLHERLRWADAMVCLLTAAYERSAWCLAELAVAQSQGKDIVPVVAQPGTGHRLIHGATQCIDYSDVDDAHQRLLKSITRAAGAGWQDAHSPFPGLRAFNRDEHQVFFGRDEETRQLTEALRAMDTQARHRMIVVEGPSGCGKSSLVRAGLLARMAKESGWLVPTRPVEPGGPPDPLRCIARTLTTVESPTPRLVSDLLVQLRSSPEALVQLADDLLAAAGEQRLLLIFDQLEELFIQAEPTTRTQFGRLLSTAVNGPVRLVATLRPEYHTTVLDGSEFSALPVDTFALRPLSVAGLRTVIEEPAAISGRKIDRELVDELVADTGSGDALPLLAFTLSELAKGSRRSDTLSITRYREIGGVTGALTRQADSALDQAHHITGRDRAHVVADLVDWFVHVDEEDRPTRRRVDHTDLPQAVTAELYPFINERLLTSQTDGAGTPTLTVTHEAFFTAWPPLAQEITRKSTALRARQEADRAADVWNADRHRRLLWDRNTIAAALVALGTRWPRFRVRLTPRLSLAPTTTEFLHTSIRRARLRRGRAIALPAILFIGTLVAAVIAFQSAATADRQHTLALSRLLVAESQTLATTEPVYARQLAAAAWHIAPTDEARDNMITLLAQSRGILVGHYGAVLATAFSPDGKVLATAGQDGTVRRWDPANGHPIGKPLTGHTGAVRAVAFSPDGRFLASASDDDTVRLWDPATGQSIGVPLTGHEDTVLAVAFSHDSKVLASASHDQSIRLWDPTNGKPIGEPIAVFAGPLNALAFSPIESVLATAGADGTIRLFDTDGYIVDLYFNHTRPAIAVAFNATGTLLASAGEENIVRLRDPSTGYRIRDLSGETGAVSSVAFSPSGSVLATAGLDHVARLWDATTGLPIGDPLSGHNGPVLAAAFNPTGTILATASYDGTVRLWNPSTGRLISDPLDLTSVTELAFSPSGTILAVGVDDGRRAPGGGVQLWDPITNRGIGEPLISGIRGWQLAFSPDGSILAGAGEDGQVRLWNPATGRSIGSPLSGHTGPVLALAFNADGTILASAGEDHTVRLWNPRTGHPVDSAFVGQAGRPSALAFDSNGRLLTAIVESDAVRVWDAIADRPISDIPTTHVTTVALSPNGGLLATGSDDRTVRLWDPENGHPAGGPLGSPTYVTDTEFGVTLSSNGKLLAIANDGPTVWLWNLAPTHPTGFPLPPNLYSASFVAFSANSGLLATGSVEADGIQVWDAALLADPFGSICAELGWLTQNPWDQFAPGEPYEPSCPAPR